MTAAYTIITLNYLAHAKTLGDSLTQHNPDIQFYVCLIGDKKDIPDISFLSPYSILDTASCAIPGFSEMRQRYTNFELSRALKPFFAEILFSNCTLEKVFYFDSDILVFNSLTLAVEALKQSSIVITPHCTEAISRNDSNRMDLILLNFGLYNAGFFGALASETTMKFLRWWQDKLKTECSVDLAKGKYVDQIWLNLAPIYFDEVEVFKDAGYNVATWNMSERKVVKIDGRFMVNNMNPLVFFHFSGYNIEIPKLLSRNHNIFSFEERPDVLPLFQEYANRLKQNKIEYFKNLDSGENYQAISILKQKEEPLYKIIYQRQKKTLMRLAKWSVKKVLNN